MSNTWKAASMTLKAPYTKNTLKLKLWSWSSSHTKLTVAALIQEHSINIGHTRSGNSFNKISLKHPKTVWRLLPTEYHYTCGKNTHDKSDILQSLPKVHEHSNLHLNSKHSAILSGLCPKLCCQVPLIFAWTTLKHIHKDNMRNLKTQYISLNLFCLC